MKNYTGYIDLSRHGDYQEIYSSQLYGVFFGIYSSFKAKKENNQYILTEMNLKLFNYKGVINMGISDAAIYELGENRISFKIEVQALNNQDTYDLDCNNICIQRGSKVLVDRRLKRIHPDGQPIYREVFDDEFYYREGGDVYPHRAPKPMEWNDTLPTEFSDRLAAQDFMPRVGDIQCPRRFLIAL